MIQVRRLGHATLTTPDIERQIAYYTEIIGLTLIERSKDRAFLACKLGLEAIALEAWARECAVAAVFSGRSRKRSDVRSRRSSPSTASRASGRAAFRPALPTAVVFRDTKGTLIEVFADYAFAKDDGAAGRQSCR